MSEYHNPFLQHRDEIKNLLTGDMVLSITDELRFANVNKKMVTIVYNDMESLIQRLKGNNVKPVKIQVSDIYKADSQSEAVKHCKSTDERTFCVCIATKLPFSVLLLREERIFAHTITHMYC